MSKIIEEVLVGTRRRGRNKRGIINSERLSGILNEIFLELKKGVVLHSEYSWSQKLDITRDNIGVTYTIQELLINEIPNNNMNRSTQFLTNTSAKFESKRTESRAQGLLI